MLGDVLLDELGDSSHHGEDDQVNQELLPLRGNPQDDEETAAQGASLTPPPAPVMRSRKGSTNVNSAYSKRRKRRRGGARDHVLNRSSSSVGCIRRLLMWCCPNASAVKSTIQCMNVIARIVFWGTVIALAAAVLWYSYELLNHGTDPHLIAWFSAGAFVLLGFPISMWGIVSHLANYNQPHVQVYVVRILWMVPIYSIESWLAMRFHKQAIYIETLRDLYESYVLYSFLQFLIQVLGGEEALILMLKDKSPTRGVHMWGLDLCVKPWLMGQPVRRDTNSRRVHWTSPFFVKCKFGVLQYVLLKFVSSIAVMILELQGWYKEGDFSPKSGYLYICLLTNISQCWALYCLIFFYYATKTELSPIRPVGKFLSVKALVFFTWWQSVVIAILYQMDMIPHYSREDWTPEDVAKGIQDYLICMEMFVAAVVHTFVFPHTEYSPQAVEARQRALQQLPSWQHKKRLGRSKYYQPWLLRGSDDHSRASSGNSASLEMMTLDSESVQGGGNGDWEDHAVVSRSSSRDSAADGGGLLLGMSPNSREGSWDHEEEIMGAVTEGEEEETTEPEVTEHGVTERVDDEDEDDDEGESEEMDESNSGNTNEDDLEGQRQTISVGRKPGFVRALLDSAIPVDLRDNTVGIVKGEYVVERKTLLHHATTHDQYDLFAPNRRPIRKPKSDDTV